MAIFLGAVKGNTNAIQKRVDEVNELIRYANSKGIKVVDKTITWEAPMMYDELKYKNGILYVSFKKLDLYEYSRKGTKVWLKENYKIGKKNTDYGSYDDNYSIKANLTEIARMYRPMVKMHKEYGYAI